MSDLGITLRPATAADQAAIKALVKLVDIMQLNLKWPHFVVAEDAATGQLAAMGQIKEHGDGTHELASIATHPDYRRRGLAHQIITHLMASHPATLWLTCLAKMGPFYAQFGFRAVDPSEYTHYFRKLAAVAKLAQVAAPPEEKLLVMRRDQAAN